MAFELLSGTFESTLDEKGRISIPARLRERYSGDLVVCQGRNFCSYVMTPEAFDRLKKNLDDNLDNEIISPEQYDAFQYQIIASAQSAEIDVRSGRIAVPAAIRSYARLTRDCLVLSIQDHLEIWDADSYRAYMEEIQRTTEEAARKLGSVRLFGRSAGGRGQA